MGFIWLTRNQLQGFTRFTLNDHHGFYMANPEPNTGFYDNPFRETQGFQHSTDNINQSEFYVDCPQQ